MAAPEVLMCGSFFSVNILFTFGRLRTRAIKGKYPLGKCEHPVKINGLFTSLFLFSSRTFTQNVNKTSSTARKTALD